MKKRFLIVLFGRFVFRGEAPPPCTMKWCKDGILKGDGGKRVPSGDKGKRVPSGDGGKCVPSGHLREAQNAPQSSTETSVGYGSGLHDD